MAPHRGIGMTSERTRKRLAQRLEEAGIENSRVLEVIRETPRHLFVDEALASRAYDDTALPIGYGQTISQPYVVALMTQAVLDGGPVEKVLEVGTGCGYQAAVLAQLVPKVFTIERIRALFEQARARLDSLRLHNVRLRLGDGYQGWPGEAPFDAIVLTAAPPEVPEALLEQLAPGGRLVAPVGRALGQSLVVLERGPGGITRRELGGVSFVPMREGTE